MNYKIESDFEYKGYRCVVVFTQLGHRCGYVGLKPNNPLYNIDYDEKVSWLKLKEGEQLGKRSVFALFSDLGDLETGVSPGLYFDVHGGITFSENLEDYPAKHDNLWWLGFDCGHAGDSKDYKTLLKYKLQDEKYVSEEMSWGLDYGEIRTQEYAEQECKNLVDQLDYAINKKIE